VPNHQTVRLIRGRHTTPERGACVMELSSMLAGEPFTDRPTCVCPVIGEFLRTYNDEVDDRRRRDLFPYASLAVGTRDRPAVERLRANMLLRWWTERDRPRRRRVRMLFWGLAPSVAARDMEIAYRSARFAAASKELHEAALALLDDLVAVGSTPTGDPVIPALPPVEADAAETAGGLGLPASCAPSRSPISTGPTKH
jgi:hypothetical protein